MAKKKFTPNASNGLHDKEYAALEVAYLSLLTGAGILRTAASALESGDEEVSRTGIWETVQAAHAHLIKANEALDGYCQSPFFEQIEAARHPLWDVLDLVFIAAHVLDDDRLPDQSEEDPAQRPTSDHPEAAPLRIAANMAAGEGLMSVAAAIAQLQQVITLQRAEAARKSVETAHA